MIITDYIRDLKKTAKELTKERGIPHSVVLANIGGWRFRCVPFSQRWPTDLELYTVHP